MTDKPQKTSPLPTILLVVAVIGVFLAMQYGPRWMVGFENFWSPRAVQEKIQQGGKMLLLDVRTVQEFKEGHLPNSVNMPMGMLQSELKNHPESFKQRYHDHTVLSICRSDSRATTAARWLQAKGLEVKVLSGGLVAWKRAGLPITK